MEEALVMWKIIQNFFKNNYNNNNRVAPEDTCMYLSIWSPVGYVWFDTQRPLKFWFTVLFFSFKMWAFRHSFSPCLGKPKDSSYWSGYGYFLDHNMKLVLNWALQSIGFCSLHFLFHRHYVITSHHNKYNVYTVHAFCTLKDVSLVTTCTCISVNKTG